MSKFITSWSPSKLADYEKCPRQAKYKTVDKLCIKCFAGRMVWEDNVEFCQNCGAPAESAPPLERGNAIHKSAEEYVRGLSTSCMPELTPVLGWLDLLKQEYKERRVRVEIMLALDANWKMVHWKSPSARVRLKIDVLWLFEPGQICVIDWKTGKKKKHWGDDDTDALDIYNVAALSAGFGTAAQAKLIYTDHNFVVPDDLTDHDKKRVKNDSLDVAGLEDRQKHWAGRALPMLQDTTFRTKPGDHCRWCDYTRNKGGPCEF